MTRTSLRARRRVMMVAAITAAVAGLTVQGAAGAVASPAGPAHQRDSLRPPSAGSAAAASLRQAHGLASPGPFATVAGHHAVRMAPKVAPRPSQVARPAPAPVWPAARTATLQVPASARSAAGPRWVRAAALPVWVSQAPARRGSPASGPAAMRVRVSVASHASAEAVGVGGLMFSLSRAPAPAAGPARVRLRVSYKAFASAFGAGFGDRLELVVLPACALATPHAKQCRAARAVPTVNDPAAGSLTATVAVAAAGEPLVLAATSTTSGGTGDFKATSLAPSSTWQVGLQSGDFTWSYPLRVPPPIAGAGPAPALSYDSQATDGETAQSNSQPGQLGEGFSLGGGGFIERRYASCADHVGDSSNDTGQTNKTGDECWDGNNAYLSLAGHSGPIVLNNSDGTWHLGADDGSTVRYINGGTSNGAYNNTHWEIITPDGTQYWFGLNELPGYTSGDQATNSVWTVPVVGLKSGDPCNTPGSYANSVCPNMAWRWNLDLVVDPNGNATSYYYVPETNYYAFGSHVDSSGTAHPGTPMSYISGGTLAAIDYGSQDNSADSNNVYYRRPMQVTFGYSDRCSSYDDPNGTMTAAALTAMYADATTKASCDASHNGSAWPDTPWDLYCSQASGCTGSGHDAPAFFDTKMLTSVTTSVYEGSTVGNVSADTWTFGYSWLSADVNSDLVMTAIYHAGDVGGSTTLPPVILSYTSLNNRVAYGENYPSMFRYRLSAITSETGAQTDIDYNAQSCSASEQSDPSSNTWPCFPQYWTAGDYGGSPTTLWFYKYTVAEVTVHDPTGGEPAMSTSYEYCGTGSPQCTSNSTGQGAAWHYDTDIDLVPAKDKSYAEWRGYRYVHVITGTSPGTQSETDYTFIRGMDGNPVKDSSGNWTQQSVAFTDSRNDPVTDSAAVNGFQVEKITYDGLDAAGQVSDEVDLPWVASAPTATSATQPWGQPLYAYPTGTSETDTYTPLSAHGGGGTRHTKVVSTFDNATGLLNSTTDYGDVSDSSQELCTAYTYPSPVSSAGLIDYPDEVKATACGTSGSPLVSDTQYLYDGQSFGTAPTAGNITRTQAWSSGDPGVTAHEVVSSKTYDSYGRVLTSTDPGQACATTSYTSAYGAGRATTSVAVTSPLTGTGCGSSTATYATTTTNLNPAWGSTTTAVDANSKTTTFCYDPLGRVTAVWLPGQAGANCTSTSGAQYTYAYSLVPGAAPFVATTTLVLGSIPVTSYQIYDALLRPRQTQSPAEGPGGGAEITDTFYDSQGNTVIQNGPYNASTTASGTLWITTENAAPNETATTYDGAGRPTEVDFDSDGTLQHKTTASYPGADAVTVIPPVGGTITTTYTDARGRTTEIDQYHSKTSASGAYDATTYAYAYVPGGATKTVTDAGGNQWKWTSDLLGRVVSASDPDTGTTTSTWNDLGQLTSTTDAAGKTVSYTYDAAGRKTAEYAAPATVGSQTASNQLAAWTYDSVKVGQLTSATAYVGGTGGEKYVQTINSYDNGYRPTSTTYTIPSNTVTGALAGTYTFTASYLPDGTPATLGYPAAGGLPAETVNFGYDNKGSPYSEWSSASDYVEQAIYTPWAAPAEVDLGTSTSAQWSRMLSSYDGATLQLTQTRIQREANGWANDTDTAYAYDQAGNITSATDSVTGDNQCFQYDYLARLSAAWAQSTAACPPSPPGASGLGGPAPYQQTLTYDNSGTANGSASGTTGNITDSTLITGSGSSATTTDISYAGKYPSYGAAQPHAPTGYTTTTNGTAVTSSQTWTKPGQLASTTTGANTTTYNWNGAGMTPGQLATVTSGTATTSYRYDPSGNLLVRKDGSTSTLYLPGQELSANGTNLSATRYYSFGGQVVAARTSTTAITWLFNDPHGTSTVAVNPAAPVSSQLTRRWYSPFGQLLAPGTGPWPGTRQFIGGTYDNTTGLTNIGAREYNPAADSFISPDPILNPQDPVDLNPYDYAYGNPVTNSDPTGLLTCDPYGDCTIATSSVPTVHVNGSSPGNQTQTPVTTGSLPISDVLTGVPHARQIERAYQAAAADLTESDGGPVPTYLDWQAIGDVCNEDPGLCPDWLARYAAMEGGIDQYNYQLAQAALAARAARFEPDYPAVVGQFLKDNRGTLASLAAIGGCLMPVVDAGCGAYLAGAYIVRAQQRIQNYGFKRSLDANIADGVMTVWFSIPIGGAVVTGGESLTGSTLTILNVSGTIPDQVQFVGGFLPGHDRVFFNGSTFSR